LVNGYQDDNRYSSPGSRPCRFHFQAGFFLSFSIVHPLLRPIGFDKLEGILVETRLTFSSLASILCILLVVSCYSTSQANLLELLQRENALYDRALQGPLEEVSKTVSFCSSIYCEFPFLLYAFFVPLVSKTSCISIESEIFIDKDGRYSEARRETETTRSCSPGSCEKIKTLFTA
jgi:hypothetical protein